MKKVICIVSIGVLGKQTRLITYGKTYTVYQEDDFDYWVEDDRGITEHYDKDYFKLIENETK